MATSPARTTIVHLNRRGRKRKGGPRKNGRPITQHAPQQDIMAVALNQPNRRWLLEKDEDGSTVRDRRLDQKAESPLGRLNLAGHVSEAEYEAGKRFARVVARYRVVLDSWDPTRGRSEGRSGDDLTDEEATKRKAAYDDMFEALHDAGHRSQYAISRVAVYEERCPNGYLPHLKRGLGVLVRHFGI